MDHSSADFPLTMDEVKEMCFRMMEERSLFDQDQNETGRDIAFNLCEH